MRQSCYRLLAFAARQKPSASAHVPAARATLNDLSANEQHAPAGCSLRAWLSTLLPGYPAFPSSAISSPVTTCDLLTARRFHSFPAPHSHSQLPDGPNPAGTYPDPTVIPYTTPTSTHPRQPRGKTGRPSRPLPPHTKPPQPQPRGTKEKAPKAVGGKAAADAAAAKAGGQQPLPREARQILDSQIALMPVAAHSHPGAVGAGLRQDLGRGEAAEAGGGAVRVTGFYIGHPITRAAADAVVRGLRKQPLAEGVALTGVYPDSEHTLIILSAPGAAAAEVPPVSPSPLQPLPDLATPAEEEAPGAPLRVDGWGAAPGPGPQPTSQQLPATPPGIDAATAAASAEGGDVAPAQPPPEEPPPSRQPGPSCMALMLLEYGGVAFFNVPEPLLLDALARVVAVVLPQAKQAGLPLPRSGQAGAKGSLDAWRQAAAEKLHKEEQLFLVGPQLFEGRHKFRWIRKADDSLLIWGWDSVNLESAAAVISQSSAIRYYNQECEEMCERYETIMPLVGDEGPEAGRSGPGAAGRWWTWGRRGGQMPLGDLRQMVFKCSGIRVRLYSRLGLREPPSSTWESARHHAVWDALRQEFELDQRSDTLMEKTDMLKQSCLDLISANNESFTKMSEIAIIALISVEILLTLTDCHGLLSLANLKATADWALGSL